jgi:hypothetical protein
VSAPAMTSRSALRPPMSVFTHPGHTEFTAMAPASYAAWIAVTALRSVFDIR